MPQTKNADGFLHQRFYVPFTRRQTLHATQLPYPSEGPYPRFSALHAACSALPGLRPLNLLNVAKQHLNAAKQHLTLEPRRRRYILSISLLIPL